MKKLIFNKKNFYSIYSRGLLLLKSWKTNRKIVVIESDDWGSIRMSNKKSYENLLSKGYNMNLSNYTLDSLENNDDLSALFDVLSSIQDCNEKKLCFTSNMVMTNPDFIEIKKNNFRNYFSETVDKTLDRYKDSDKVRNLWKEGNDNQIFCPQYHAREHIQFWSWISDLYNDIEETRETFEYNICGLPQRVSKINKSYYVPIYVDDKILNANKLILDEIISQGMQMFKNEFGFSSKSVIAPNCGWTNLAEKIWSQNNVKYIQEGYLQEHHNEKKIIYIPHYLGQKAKSLDMIYLVRNCTFEPSKFYNQNYWESTLSQIKRAFMINTPAIISTHRVNYIGSIKESNRKNSLIQLKKLLLKVKSLYPDVEFMTSVELGDLIC